MRTEIIVTDTQITTKDTQNMVRDMVSLINNMRIQQHPAERPKKPSSTKVGLF